MPFKKIIVQSIYNYNDDYFRIESINEYISKITNPETGVIKYIVFESSKVYTSLESLIELISILDNGEYTSANTLRIPFFAGCSSTDLSQFLFEKTNIPFELDLKISYDILPIDFNIPGLFRFFNYMSILKKSYPIFKTGNALEEHLKVISGKIKDSNNINRVIPSQFLSIVPDEPFIHQIIELVQEKETE